jgi:co-chaperonin GroES (HSP10)
MKSEIFEEDIIRRVTSTNTLIPRNDAVIVYRVKLISTAGGIMLPETQNHKASLGYATVGVVVAVGPGRFIEITGGREPLDLEPGDTVLFSAQAGLELGQVVRKELGPDLAHEEIRLIRAHDIICQVFKRNFLKD